MRETLNKVMKKLKDLSRVRKILLGWYFISFIIIVLEILINFQLDNNVYFHPIISILIRILLVINLFLIPIILTIISLIKQNNGVIKKIFLIFISSMGISLLSLCIIVFISLVDRATFNIDTEKIEFQNNRIIVENRVWLETKSHVNIYEIENFFFVRLTDHDIL